MVGVRLRGRTDGVWSCERAGEGGGRTVTALREGGAGRGGAAGLSVKVDGLC